jgi:hypothetical protein
MAYETLFFEKGQMKACTQHGVFSNFGGRINPHRHIATQLQFQGEEHVTKLWNMNSSIYL